jgi:hypothetical protein
VGTKEKDQLARRINDVLFHDIRELPRFELVSVHYVDFPVDNGRYLVKMVGETRNLGVVKLEIELDRQFVERK